MIEKFVVVVHHLLLFFNTEVKTICALFFWWPQWLLSQGCARERHIKLSYIEFIVEAGLYEIQHGQFYIPQVTKSPFTSFRLYLVSQ